MAVEREHWKSLFEKLPSWLCPTCQSGSLALNKDTLKVLETAISQKGQTHEASDPTWMEMRFSALLVCQNTVCGEITAIGGCMGYVENDDWKRKEMNWDPVYVPVFMSPAPPVFRIPKQCPEAVTEQLKKAFSLFWSDTGSCANRLRAAAEALLTERKIPRTTVNKRRKRERISLHARIEKFKQINSHSADSLLAIKWLGNAGSHANLDELSRDDLLDGFELFEHVLERIYVKREERLTKIAKNINSRKGHSVKRRRALA